MKIIDPSVEIISPFDEQTILKHLELCGRTAYKSEQSISEDSAKRFIKHIIDRGHESVLEHYNITVRFICDRGVSHQLVRHRLASYTQESQRYCNYSQDKFGNEITIINPTFFKDDTNRWNMWWKSCKVAEQQYFSLLEAGATPQEARTVLPNSLKTEVMVTTNIREWRHILKLRTSKAAHPQIQELMIMLLKQFKEKIPILFDDITIGDN